MTDLKEKLHLLVGACPNEALLQEIKTHLETCSNEDWWNELSKTDQHLLLESETQYERKEFTSHSELMKRFEEWKRK